MKEANIFIANDNQKALRILRLLLEAHGHHVVSTASDIETARQEIDLFPQKQINVAILDANLEKDVRTGDDGIEMATKIQTAHPHVKIIGLSGNVFPIPVDVDLGALNMVDTQKVVDQF